VFGADFNLNVHSEVQRSLRGLSLVVVLPRAYALG
jgi:hypothetical protein